MEKKTEKRGDNRRREKHTKRRERSEKRDETIDRRENKRRDIPSKDSKLRKEGEAK